MGVREAEAGEARPAAEGEVAGVAEAVAVVGPGVVAAEACAAAAEARAGRVGGA